MTFESSVEPSEYHLGPGDVFECRFWTSGETFYPKVSADDKLFVPNLGSFDVRNKTLASLDSELDIKIAQSFSSRKLDPNNPPVTMSLYAPRNIYVSVQGDVETPGRYVFSAGNRGDLAVDVANRIDPALQSQQLNNINPNDRLIRENGKKRLNAIFGNREAIAASQRYITVVHADGTRDRVDLVRYRTMHDPKAAPPLREGDVIDVPLRDMNAPSLGVYGAVFSAGDFEFVPGDSLSAAVKYAFGPKPNADLHHVELTRITANGDVNPPTVYDLTRIEAHADPDVPLMPNDQIVVRALPEQHIGAIVDVRGEVAEPGAYPITDGKTTLSDVIREAGGLTKDAYAQGGTVLRHGYGEQLVAGTPEDIARSSRLEDLSVSDTGNYSKQLSMRPPYVAVNMQRLFIQGDHSADVVLNDGDEIVIPRQPTTVYVNGFVNNAGYVNYSNDAPLSYYIAQAGGYANGADKSTTAVIKYPSKSWMEPGDTKIEPGDEIYVPKEPDYPVGYETQNLSSIAGLLTGIGGLIVSLYLAFIKK